MASVNEGFDNPDADRDPKDQPGAGQLGTGRPDTTIAGKEDAGRMAQPRQGSGKGPDDIAEPTGLGEGNALRRDEDDVHAGCTPSVRGSYHARVERSIHPWPRPVMIMLMLTSDNVVWGVFVS